jgi:hypothetical protein
VSADSGRDGMVGSVSPAARIQIHDQREDTD